MDWTLIQFIILKEIKIYSMRRLYYHLELKIPIRTNVYG